MTSCFNEADAFASDQPRGLVRHLHESAASMRPTLSRRINLDTRNAQLDDYMASMRPTLSRRINRKGGVAPMKNNHASMRPTLSRRINAQFGEAE